MKRNSFTPWLAIAVPLAAASVADARRLPDWPYEKLFKEADLVVIAESQGTASTKDDFGHNPWPLEVVGRETTFRVAHALKGEPGKGPIKVLHFAFGAPKAGEGDAPIVRNGPGFVAFRTKEVTADTADRAHDRFTLPRPQYLMFLRKRADGRYEPVSGQTDPNLSVREMLPPAWSDGLRAADEPALPTVLRFSEYVPVRAVAFSPDGTRLAAAGGGLIRVFDATTGKEARTLEGLKKGFAAVAFDPTGKVLASGNADRTVTLWDLATGKPRATLTGHDGPVNAVAFRPDGKAVASGSDDKTVRVWDPEAGKETTTITGHRDSVLGVAYSPDGALLASCGGDGTVRLWDPRTGRGGRAFTMLGSVWGVAVGPGGKVAGASASRKTPLAQVWDAPTGGRLATLTGHRNGVLAIAFSPDGGLLATASADTTVRLWDAETGGEVAVLAGHEKWVRAVAFSPDGKRVASGGDDRTIRLWHVPPLPGKH